jgi:hypothetical protein
LENLKTRNIHASRSEAPAAAGAAFPAEGIDPQHVAVFETYIDPTEFRVVRGYLQDPKRGIDYVWHVRERAMLAPLAARLDQALSAGQPVEPILRPLWQNGSLKISARQPLPARLAEAQLDAGTVSPKVGCDVIDLPPFYLAHRPGLLTQGQEQSAGTAPQSAGQTRNSVRLQRQRSDHEMSH